MTATHITAPVWYNEGSRYLTRLNQGVNLLDNQKLELGTGLDATLYYDGTDLFIAPKEVGSGRVLIGTDAAGPAILDEAVSGTNPTLIPDRSDLDTGIGRSAANTLSLIAGGVEIGKVSSTGIEMDDAAGPALLNEAATNTNPAVIPNRADPDTGIGWNGSGALSIVTNGSEVTRFTATGHNMNQDVQFNGANLLMVTNFIELKEMSAPGAGAANSVRIYAVVDGGFKTDLAAIFQDGVAQIFAQEP